jgi:uncharacterized protein (TIRG00374 family)
LADAGAQLQCLILAGGLKVTSAMAPVGSNVTREFPHINLYRHVLIPSLVGSTIFAVLVVIAGARSFSEHIADFPVSLVPAILALSLGNYVLRALRWVIYLRVLEPHVQIPVLVRVFVAGLSMSASPGKIGEFLKAVWLNGLSAVPVPRTAAAVLWERLLDLGAVILLALGAVTMAVWASPLLGGMVGLGALVLVVALVVPAVRRRVMGLLRHPRLSRMAVGYDALRALASPRVLAVAIPLSVAAWFLEGFSLWLILNALGVDLPIYQAVALYALATLAGALSLLPGGLGSTEAVMVGLLVAASASGSLATTATVLVRGATLWFAIVVGLVMLPFVFRDLRSSQRRPPPVNDSM